MARSVRDHPVRVALVSGIVCRVAGWLADRSYWLDEGSIVGCILKLDETGLFGPLGSSQLAPPGFLASEWAAIHLVGTSRVAFRVVPLLAGIAALFGFHAVARRCLPGRVEWVAVLLFAVTGDLIYFASEVKQYSSDLALTLGCLVVAFRSNRGPTTWGQAVGLAAMGVGVVWCSHPAIFTLAAIGVVGLARALRDQTPRRGAVWVAIGLAWLASFALVHAVAMRQLGYRRDMWAFWDFAFPPVPPRSVWDLIWPVRRIAFLFASPLNFDAPIGAAGPDGAEPIGSHRLAGWVCAGGGLRRVVPVSRAVAALLRPPAPDLDRIGPRRDLGPAGPPRNLAGLGGRVPRADGRVSPDRAVPAGREPLR